MFEIAITNRALKDLRFLPKHILDRIDAAILALRDDPFPSNSKKLADNAESIYRIRSGDYRILYQVDTVARMVTIARVLHRKDAYKNM